MKFSRKILGTDYAIEKIWPNWFKMCFNLVQNKPFSEFVILLNLLATERRMYVALFPISHTNDVVTTLHMDWKFKFVTLTTAHEYNSSNWGIFTY